jgi:hypothetical protein
MVAPHPMASFLQLIMAAHEDLERHRRTPAPRPDPLQTAAAEPAPAPAPASVPVPRAAPGPLVPRQIDLEHARRVRS